jgi:predicted AlkP superfamily pyrophosphatase or phosphodiesterase
MMCNLMKLPEPGLIQRTMSILRLRSGQALAMSILCMAGTCESSAQNTPAASHHVVLIVWDGMRPDFVNEEETPALWRLARGGVVFRNHHSVYPSATNVNGTALVTGVYPGHSGIIANHEYRPEIDNKKAIDVENAEVVRRGDELSRGKHVASPTIAELVRGTGRDSVIATAKTVGLLQDRHLDLTRAKNSALLFSGQTLSPSALAPIVAQLGTFPRPFAQKDVWTTKAMTDIFWENRLPVFSLLWLSEPDGTQHETAPGSESARAAIKSADDNLAAVLAALDRPGLGGARSTTDIFVVSDHGFSTIERSIDLRRILKEAGFSVATEFSSDPKTGDIVLAGNGGTVFFYVAQRDAGVTRRLVDFLQQSDFAGVILTRNKFEGTFGMDTVKIDNEHAPDVALAFRWNEKKNQFGVPGMINADWNRPAGEGTHATLSRFDMHNTLIAAGPDFRREENDETPSGNVDLAPTILQILGINPTHAMDGRVLVEAMRKSEKQSPKAETETIEATKMFSTGTWRQSLRVSRVGSTNYLDEGNGAFTPRNK